MATANSFLTLSALLFCVVNSQLPSFEPPFVGSRTSGRSIDGWQTYGHGVVHKNFVRLTPDRQSKSGALIGLSPITEKEWISTIRFRISGQGQKWFGDGFAVWLSSTRTYSPGAVHGREPDSGGGGFGLLFDTFVNHETKSTHRDVSLFRPDIDKDGVKEVIGCNAKFRSGFCGWCFMFHLEF